MEAPDTFVYGCIDCGKSFQSSSGKSISSRLCYNCCVKHVIQKKLPLRMAENFSDTQFAVEKGLMEKLPGMVFLNEKKEELPEDLPVKIIYGCIDCGKSYIEKSPKPIAGRLCKNCRTRHMIKAKVPLSKYDEYVDKEFAKSKGLINEGE